MKRRTARKIVNRLGDDWGSSTGYKRATMAKALSTVFGVHVTAKQAYTAFGLLFLIRSGMLNWEPIHSYANQSNMELAS